ncbi:hypothetical protein [Amaricoccus sp.]|uniref:hypothetical protein n=1 Tax=Amaricoccus sp. TaxID=1872485 RepID=UPI001B3D703F|nr:hypothetical protein [Amaricoccus sp.]MBP7001683.1 hypothetical protein [Amaricoccus sp.]
MATPDQIPSDLTLEIGADLAPDQFLALTRAFFGYLAEVAEVATDKPPRWTVQVHHGSALISLVPPPSAPPAVLHAIYARAAEGAEALAAGDIEGAAVPEAAMKHLKVMSEMSEGGRTAPTPIRLWIERRPVAVTPEIAHTIREDWRIAYQDFGTAEGRLQAIEDAPGSLRFRLRDEALGLTLKCYFPEGLLPDVFSSFRRRVEVAGMIEYRRDGTPISISAGSIEVLPDDADLPTPADVRGILRAVG